MPKAPIFHTLTGASTITLIIFWLLSCVPATAQSITQQSNDEKCSFSAIYENDKFLTDENYTFGVFFTNSCISVAGYRDLDKDDPVWQVSRWLNKVVAKRFSFSTKPYVGKSVYAGLSAFTPNDYTKAMPDKGDGRPYASLAIYGDRLIFADDAAGNAFKQDLQLGLLGMRWGGILQREVHRLFNLTIPEGWSSQISNGGEPTFLYSLRGTKLLLRSDETDGRKIFDFDLSANLEGKLGYFNSVQGSLSARIGQITSPFWVDFGPIYSRSPHVIGRPRELEAQSKSGPTKAKEEDRGNEVYVFLAGGVDLVLYSALLQGQFRNNDYEIASSAVERLVPHAVIGFVIQLGRMQLSYSHSYREPEIKGGRSHRWNSLSLGFFY